MNSKAITAQLGKTIKNGISIIQFNPDIIIIFLISKKYL